MARVLALLRSSLDADGLFSSFTIGTKLFEVRDVSYVDDVAIPVMEKAEGLTSKIGAIANCAYSVFS